MAGSVGVCGLGNMGGAIAGRLAEAFTVVGYDPDAQRADTAGVRAADDLAGLVAEAEVIVLSLPAPAVSQAVVTSLAAAASPGTLVIEASTVTPDDVRRMGETVRRRRARSHRRRRAQRGCRDGGGPGYPARRRR